MKNLNRAIRMISFGLLVAAVVKELRLPREQRTWHGTLLGFVPYDLRIPTLHRLEETFWNPSSERILVPTAFGVGWSVNFGAVASQIKP